jgi:hypothetical protein
MNKANYLVLAILFLASSITIAQEKLSIKVELSSSKMKVNQTLQLKAKVIDENGKEVKGQELAYYSRSSRIVEIDDKGMMTAHAPGKVSLIIISPSETSRLRQNVDIEVEFPPIAKVEVEEVPTEIYLGTTLPLKIKIIDEMGMERKDLKASISSSNEGIITADPFYNLKSMKIGKAVVTVESQGIEGKININVVDNPVAKVVLSSPINEARTGDVFHFEAKAYDKKGKVVSDAPITFSFQGQAADVSSSASGLIKQDGRFVADEAGLYNVSVSSGPYSDNMTVNIQPRNVKRKFEKVGKGVVGDKHTSDFWVWEGIDGRDYAVTGTWGADGTTYFWDVTNPSDIIKIDSVQVDARTVNDVKISEDGTICVISREGASNRKNGIVIIDVSNPSDAKVISTFTENLTGGVHNVFIYEKHVYALSNGEKYYIINIEDPKNPKAVGEFELDTPGHAIHDVWVEDGIAYSSNWDDGVYLVDVGNGIAGGSPSNPVAFANYEYPSGAHHATFPFKSKSANKFYTILGDEIFPYGLDMKGPNVAAGFLHFVDFTDMENPEEIARFKVPGTGSHNYWVDGETLYVAIYNGGVRVVDISGELMGDLYKQGREIGWILPSDPNGYIPNSPFTWGAQLHKGHVFYSDWNSGLGSAKLEGEKPANTQIESK